MLWYDYFGQLGEIQTWESFLDLGNDLLDVLLERELFPKVIQLPDSMGLSRGATNMLLKALKPSYFRVS